MNLENCTFLGDFDDHYEVRLLNGDILPIRINMINEDNVKRVIVDAAREVGIIFREHRLEVVPPSDDNPHYLVFQNPVNVTRLVRDYGDVVELHLNSLTEEGILDFLDYTDEEKKDEEKKDEEKETLLKETKVWTGWNPLDWTSIAAEVAGVWPCERLILTCQTGLASFLNGFGVVAGDRVKELEIVSTDMYQVVDALCAHFPKMTDLRLPEGFLLHTDRLRVWGEKLLAQTNVNVVHFYMRERHEVTPWVGWRVNFLYAHDRPNEIRTVQYIRSSLGDYGQLLGDFNDFND